MSSKPRLRKKFESKEKISKPDNEDISSTKESKEEGEAKPRIKIDFKRITIRCILIFVIIAVVNYIQRDKLESFAGKEEIRHKDATFECSSEFLKSVKKYQGCRPKQCGRFVTDTPISLSEAQALSIIAQKIFGKVGPEGTEYSTFDVFSGTLTTGTVTNLYRKDNSHKIVTSEDLKIYRHITDKIKLSIVNQFGLTSKSVHMAQPTFFTYIDPRFSGTPRVAEYWKPHVDKEKYASWAYVAHLFLTDYDYHFKGGRLFFVDQSVNKTVDPKVGRLIAYTSGSENMNFIERVTSGTRLSITIPFTCDPKKDIQDIKFPS